MYTYLLENKKGVIYIGSTEELEKRVQDHNDPTQSGWTKTRGQWRLIPSEKFSTRAAAMKREQYLKSLKAGKRIKQILNISEE
jgi:predicted GIY-YIG superfamily endonuclease